MNHIKYEFDSTKLNDNKFKFKLVHSLKVNPNWTPQKTFHVTWWPKWSESYKQGQA